MKKSIIYIGIPLLIILVYLLTTIIIVHVVLKEEKVESEKVIAIYENNKTDFQNIKKALYGKNIVFNKDNDNYIEIYDYNTNEEIKSNNYEYQFVIDFILENNIKSVYIDNDYLKVTIKSGTGFGQSIINIEDKDLLNKYFDIIEMKEIDKNWYYVETE